MPLHTAAPTWQHHTPPLCCDMCTYLTCDNDSFDMCQTSLHVIITGFHIDNTHCHTHTQQRQHSAASTTTTLTPLMTDVARSSRVARTRHCSCHQPLAACQPHYPLLAESGRGVAWGAHRSALEMVCSSPAASPPFLRCELKHGPRIGCVRQSAPLHRVRRPGRPRHVFKGKLDRCGACIRLTKMICSPIRLHWYRLRTTTSRPRAS